ncbi:MAG: glycosyltransferase [Pseudomonadota bacterium]
MKNKILFISYTSQFGGAEMFLVKLLEKLNKDFFEPYVVSPPGGVLGEKIMGLGCAYDPIDLIPLRKQLNILAYFKNVLQIIKYVKRNKINLVCCNAATSAFWGVIAAKICRVPAIVYVHTRFAPRFASIFFKMADRIIILTSAAKKLPLKLGVPEHKIKIIKPIFDREKFLASDVLEFRMKYGLEKQDFLVGMIARIEPLKGQHLILEAAKQLANIKDIKWMIVGDLSECDNIKEASEYLNKLKWQILEFGLESSVIMTGFINEGMASVYKALDLVVLPSYTEMLPISILEAMIVGKAVVATDVGGVRDLIEDGQTGMLVPPGNADAIAKAVTELYKNPQKNKALGEAAFKKAAKEFDYRKNIMLTEKYYRQIINREQISLSA